MKQTIKKRIYWIGLLGILLSLYPLFVMSYTWSYVFRSNLEGGRHGPLDAYRHTLASAVVAYTLDKRAVYLVNRLFEGGGKSSNDMDVHNNCIGAEIGSTVESFSDIEPAVLFQVRNGARKSKRSDQITWMSKDKWRNARMW